MKIKEIIHWLLPSRRWKMVAIALSGLIIGGGLFFLYMLRAHTYLGDDRQLASIAISWDPIMPPGCTALTDGMLRVMIVMFLMRIR